MFAGQIPVLGWTIIQGSVMNKLQGYCLRNETQYAMFKTGQVHFMVEKLHKWRYCSKKRMLFKDTVKAVPAKDAAVKKTQNESDCELLWANCGLLKQCLC